MRRPPSRLGLLAHLTLLALISLATGCAPGPRGADAGKRQAEMRGRLLRVLPIDSLAVHNPEDFRDDWQASEGSKDAGTVLSDLLGEGIWSRAEHVEVLYDDVPVAESDFRDTLLALPGKDSAQALVFRFPTASALRRRNAEPDLALQVSHVGINREARSRTGGIQMSVPNGIGPPAGLFTFLCLTGRYMVWDYRADAPVAYGVVEGCSGFVAAMARENWENCMDHAVRNLIAGTPFLGGRNRIGANQRRKSNR